LFRKSGNLGENLIVATRRKWSVYRENLLCWLRESKVVPCESRE